MKNLPIRQPKPQKANTYILITALFLLLMPLFASPQKAAAAQDPSTTLKWGGNADGGVPFILYDPRDNHTLTGFETEIAQAVAAQLGLTPEFVQNDWDALIPGLEREIYDVVINGIEVTPERKEVINFSIPYYITYLQIVTPRDSQGIETLEDCIDKVIGTLKQSYAYDTLVEAGVKDIRSYVNEASAYQDMLNGRLDAVFMDAPMSIYYAGFRPEFKFVGQPIGRIEYAMALRKEDKDLLEDINQAIITLRDDGTLRNIYERWALWNPLMADYFQDPTPPDVSPIMFQMWGDYQRQDISLKARLDRYLSFLPILGKAALVTLQISITSMFLAVFLGLILAIARLFGPKWLSKIASLIIEIIRGTPLLIQLFFIFYGLPNIGIKLSPIMSGWLGLGINYAAYEAENYRAGLLSVPRQQMEGALALGMTKPQALRHVLLPQAFRISLLPMTNDFIALLKDSSLVSTITIIELTKAYGQLASTYYDYFGTGIIVAIIYLLIGLPFVKLARYLENKLAVSIRGKQVKGQKKVARPGNY